MSAVVEQNTCTGCQICVGTCPVEAIEMVEEVAKVNATTCTDCGACERSCPVGINMRILTKKLEMDGKELFDWEAGLDPDVRPALDVYQPNDPDVFIK